MNNQFRYKPIEDSQELKLLNQILAQCFSGFGGERLEKYQKNIGINNFRIICQDNHIIGGLAIYFMGQYFGGKSLPMAGIAAVGIAPEYRGQKAATFLMEEVVNELYQKNIPFSTLYPATQRLYRGVGYEQAGVYCQWEIPLDQINCHNRILPIAKINNPKAENFIELYQKQAIENNGYLDRSFAIWQSILHPK
jgi:predicted acetyltransferase